MNNLPEGQYFQMDSYNFDTRRRKHDALLVSDAECSPNDEEISQYMSDSVEFAFNEDREILTEVQKGYE